MNLPAKEVIEKMFAAFPKGDVEKILETLSEDSVWIYHGTQIIPKGRFEGKDTK
jgi:ketosteroid isomerase-like protein